MKKERPDILKEIERNNNGHTKTNGNLLIRANGLDKSQKADKSWSTKLLPLGLKVEHNGRRVVTEKPFSAHSNLGPISLPQSNRKDIIEEIEEIYHSDSQKKKPSESLTELGWIEGLFGQEQSENSINCEMIIDNRSGSIFLNILKDLETNDELFCSLKILNQSKNGDSAGPLNLEKNGDQVVNPVRRNKQCIYCGIAFSNLDTLQAHMLNYCSKRPELDKDPPTDLSKATPTDLTKQRSTLETLSLDSLNGLNEAALRLLLAKMNKFYSKVNSKPLQSVEPTEVMPLTKPTRPPPIVEKPKDVRPSSESIDEFHCLRENGPHFCSMCHRFFDSRNLYISHILMSRKINELDSTNPDQEALSIFALSQAAEKMGLTLAAPLHSTNGSQYIPINPLCGQNRTKSQVGSCDDNQGTPTSRPESTTVDVEGPVNLVESKAIKEVLFQHSQEQLLASILSSFYQANALPQNDQNGQSFGSLVGQRNQIPVNGNGNQNNCLRPYLCTQCHTRFQALTTFQAHQKFYCQGRKRTSTGIQDPHNKRRRSVSPLPINCDDHQRTTLTPRSSPKSQNSAIQNQQDPTSPSDSAHLSSDALKCRLCGYIGQTQRGIRIHMKTHNVTYESGDEEVPT